MHVRDRVMPHGPDNMLESRVHLCQNFDGTWPHHIELHLYSTGPLPGDPYFMGMMAYTAAEARELAALLTAAADDLDGRSPMPERVSDHERMET